MESEDWGEPCLLSPDEERLIWAVNYFGGELRNLEQCRAFVDGKMKDFEERNPELRANLVGAIDVVEAKV